jgi:hypothetical protein
MFRAAAQTAAGRELPSASAPVLVAVNTQFGRLAVQICDQVGRCRDVELELSNVSRTPHLSGGPAEYWE